MSDQIEDPQRKVYQYNQIKFMISKVNLIKILNYWILNLDNTAASNDN